MSLEIIILAAGKGTRMHSKKPKVLHTIAGKPILQHVVEQSQLCQPQKIHVVYGHEGQQVKSALSDFDIHWVHQAEQLGTGHAVGQALEFIDDNTQVLILVSDIPLLSADTLKQLHTESQYADLTLLTAVLPDPTGLGRIIIEDGNIKAIIEHKDATDKQRKITEINSGVMLAKAAALKTWIPQLKNNNAQGEIYLTDIVSLAVNQGKQVNRHITTDPIQVQGINDKLQLELVEREYQKRLTEKLMRAGVTLIDSNRIDIRGELSCGKDVRIEPNVIFEGSVQIEDDVVIGANCVIKNTFIKKGAVINEFSSIDGAVIGEQAQVGPFARLRTGSELGLKSKVGNFVEMKKTQLGDGAKASHLSYVGDAVVGKDVNIGAGTITCNYDGVDKHKTVIDDGAFIGSGTQLVAPIHVGENATIGAGTTLRRNAPADELTLSSSPQKTIEGWKRKK